jgi:hypothetical protein
MTRTFQHNTRPGSLGLSLFTLAGLILLAAHLWESMPGYVMVVFIPALMASIAQLVVSPVYGLQISDKGWRIEADGQTLDLAACDIAYLRLQDRGARPRAVIVLSGGAEIEMPQTVLPDPLVLIREATERGIPVRHA